MSVKAIRPSTLDGIKRLANALKKERGIPHASALDAAAQAGGFQNFRHARNVLGTTTPAAPAPAGHTVYLTSYWNDKPGNAASLSGRETLPVVLKKPWHQLVRIPEFAHYRYLPTIQCTAPDQLVMHARLQSRARRDVCMLARLLRFMEATGLKLSGSRSRAYPKGDPQNAVPRSDHSSIWYQPTTKRYLYADEPYEAAARSAETERVAWAQRFQFAIAKPTWPGMYNPDGGTRLYLTADVQRGVDLPAVVAVLDQLPAPIVEENWSGESAPAHPFFVSPAEATRAKPKVAARSAGPRSTVAYSLVLARGRRPDARMAIEDHERVGSLLKSVLTDTRNRVGVYNRVNSVRSQLDDWLQCEYPSEKELPQERFFEIYYHEGSASSQRVISAETRAQCTEALRTAKDILTARYPTCPPLRALGRKIDSAMASLASWR